MGREWMKTTAHCFLIFNRQRMFKRSVSQLGFVDLAHRSAPRAFAKRPTSLREISAAGQELGIDVFFTPQYMWLAEEYLSAKLPEKWSQVFDQQHQAYYYYNDSTGESSWENPHIDYYRTQFQKQQTKDEAQGATVLGMAKRRLSVHKANIAEDAPPQGIAEGSIVRPSTSEYRTDESGSGGSSKGETKARMSKLRNKLKQAGKVAVSMKVKKGTSALRGGDDSEVYTPKMFEELCQYLNIHIVDRNPTKVETHLVHLALEYLDRVHSGELPNDWTAYMDTEGNIPYYYNARTGENTYDHPLATVMKEQVIASREASKAGDEAWARGTVADYWLAFGGDTVTYYNLRTRKTFRSPPHVAREAALTIVKIMRMKDTDKNVSVQRADIVDAFHALDGDQSGSVSAAELRPVLIHLGGLSEQEVDSFVASADIDGDGEMDYNEFVDTLWTRFSHKQQQQAQQGKESSFIQQAKGDTYEVHGHLHDAAGEKATQRAEELAWKTEQEQRLIKDDLLILAGKVDQTKGSVKEAWTIIDYNRALDLLSRGRNVQVFDEEDIYHTNVAPLARKVMRAIAEYEEAEAERRAAAIMQGHHDEAEQLGGRRDACRRKLRAAMTMFNEVKVIEFKEAVMEVSLNGFLYPEVVDLEQAVAKVADLLSSVEERSQRMPERELDLKENMVKRFETEVNAFVDFVEQAKKVGEGEILRRRDVEKRAIQAKEMNEVRQRQQANAAKEKSEAEEKARVDALNALDDEYARAEEEAEKQAQERQQALENEKKKLTEEMNKLEEEQNDEHNKVQEWANTWDPMAFASEEEREEAEIRHEIKMEEMKIRAAEEKKKNDIKMKRMKEEMLVKEEKLRIQLLQEAQERKKQEGKAREVAEAKARWEADQAREDQRTKSRERRHQLREDKLQKARAELESLDLNKREEAKKEAKLKCDAFGGDVWDACKKGDAETVRNFFILHGTATLLEGKMSRCHHREEWGRTLVHTSAWWGHTNILRFLLTLGANVNVHDTSVTRTTPLLEAARAGNRHICEFLIRYGAKVKIADSTGDNPFHWAARRGHGTLITAMLHRSEEFQGSSSTRGCLSSENNKLLTPLDVATNETIQKLIKKELKRHGEKNHARKKSVARIRGGLLRAKMVGKLDTGNEERKKRYGDGNDHQKKKKKKGSGLQKKKSKKKKKGINGPETDSLSSNSGKLNLPEVKTRKPKLHKTPSYIAAVKEANKHHGDAGDGGVPDELVALMGDDFMDGFHYGVREF
jgi:predicted lactoylglutathione lyase